MNESLSFGNPGEVRGSSVGANPQAREAPAEPHPYCNFPVVGIGASAGGLEALRALFHDVTHLTGLSFVVVTHLDPTRKSLLAELLQKNSSLIVKEATDLEPLRPNHVYVIPPNTVLTLKDGRFSLDVPRLPRGFRDPINTLFTSLAGQYRERSVGVVLSGTGTDGVHGAEAIKRAGGCILIQDPNEAAFSGMPSSVAALGLADSISKLCDIPQKIDQWRNQKWPLATPVSGANQLPEVSSSNAERVIALLRDRCNHDFSNYRRGTLLRRLRARIEKTQAGPISKYLALLENSQEERIALVDELLINVTGFFRDPTSYDFIRAKVFPSLVQQVDSTSRHLRVWVPACASGEEAYSLAILFFEQMEKLNRQIRVHIFATDIDDDALERARDGFYKANAVSGLSKEQLAKYFIPTKDGYRVSRKLRDVIVFAKHDLLADAPLPRMLMISCRNVFIYFDRDAQDRLIRSSFSFSLVPNGYLFLGSTESVSNHNPGWTQLTSNQPVYIYAGKESFRAPRAAGGIVSPKRMERATREFASFSKQSAPNVKQKAYEEILKQASPPMFVVDSENRVIFCSEKAKIFLRIGSGILETKLDSIVHPEVRWEIAHLIRTLRKSPDRSLAMKAVRVSGFELDSATCYDLEGIKLSGLEAEKSLIAVTAYPFHQNESVADDKTETVSGENHPTSDLRQKNRQLEAELLRLRTSQSAAISELENLNSELSSSNEEFGTLNEELQAATEELETNREELQSINEELQSVNAELNLKVQQLSESNDDLHNLLSCTNLSVLLLDADSCLKRFTLEAGQIFSLRESDIGRKISEFKRVFPAEVINLCKQVSSSSNPAERQVQFPAGDWYQVRILPYVRSERELDGLIITLQNVTEIKSYQEALGRFQGRSKALVDSLPGNLLLCDENGVIQYCKESRGPFRLFDPETVVGKRFAELKFGEIRIDPEKIERIAELARETFLDKTEKAIELSAKISRGPALWFDVRCVACGTEGVLIFFHEITERKRLELELNRAVHAAEISNRAKTDFIANVSHELRTPLNSVIGFAQLLNRSVETLDKRTTTDYVRRIEDSGRILLHLVNELLDLAQIDSGKLELHMAKTSLTEIVRDCVSLMAHQFGEKQQVCGLELPVAPLEVFADEKRLRQVVINILSNASKFSPNGTKVKVNVRIARQDCITIEISDSGPGVPPEMLHSIFERFVRHVNENDRPQVGAGLGLAISKSIIDAHGGTITARTPGIDKVGLTILIELPMRTI